MCDPCVFRIQRETDTMRSTTFLLSLLLVPLVHGADVDTRVASTVKRVTVYLSGAQVDARPRWTS